MKRTGIAPVRFALWTGSLRRMRCIGLFPISLLGALALALAACGGERKAPPQLHELHGPTMGSEYRLKWHGGASPAEVGKLLQQQLAAADSTFSNWRKDSEIAAFNAHASTEPFRASMIFCDAVQMALYVADRTDGAFDPTVKPLVDLYREQKRTGLAPTAEAIAAARARVGWRDVRRVAPDKVAKSRPDVELDLDGLVAGLVADTLVHELAGLGVTNFMLDITGEVTCRGVRPDGNPWRIGIVDPQNATVGAEQSLEIVPLADRALCTSGDYRNFVVVDGKVTTHIFDPRTAQNTAHGVVSVSVYGRSCAIADAVGTALMVTGPASAPSLLSKLRAAMSLRNALVSDPDLAAWFVVAKPDGTFESVPVDWPAAFRADGTPLPQQALDDAARQKHEAELADALRAFEQSPDSVEAAVWVGRRLGYLGRFRDAVRHYTDALQRHPDDPQLLRHRGHRYLTLRDFESACADLARAAEVVKGKPDEVEPDGKPTPGRAPHGTLHYAIRYHLGLAQFCLLDFAAAERAFRDCLQVSRNDESRVAATHWLCSSLFAQQRFDDCAPLLAALPKDADVVENRHYFDLCRLYRGDVTFAELAAQPAPWGSSLAFGAAHYAWRKKGIDAPYAPKTEAEALSQLRAIAQRSDWHSFGVIAAEAITAGR